MRDAPASCLARNVQATSGGDHIAGPNRYGSGRTTGLSSRRTQNLPLVPPLLGATSGAGSGGEDLASRPKRGAGGNAGARDGVGGVDLGIVDALMRPRRG